VLTGDKPDTSISVAFSAKLIDHEYRIFDFHNLNTKEMYLLKIFEYLEHVESNKNGKYGLILQTEELKMIQSDNELVDKVQLC
jgi:magnesium-transporting ATPase (P-type)